MLEEWLLKFDDALHDARDRLVPLFDAAHQPLRGPQLLIKKRSGGVARITLPD